MRLQAEFMTDSNAYMKKIGYMGVGFMGHGAAKNILEKGFPLTVLGHKNREPVDDLLKRGAQEASTPADLALRSDIVFMCLPSSRHVEEAVFSESGIGRCALRQNPQRSGAGNLEYLCRWPPRHGSKPHADHQNLCKHHR